MPWILVITGGIGSGKSTAGEMFSSLGIPVIDLDIISHAITAPRGLAMEEIRKAFGDEAIEPSGALNRKYIRELIFADTKQKEKLENIMHPIIADIAQSNIEANKEAPYIVLINPLYAEYPNRFIKPNRVLVIDCEEKTQINRVMKRSSLSSSEVQSIMGNQTSRQKRLAVANEVILNEEDIDSLKASVEKIHPFYLELATEFKKKETHDC